MTTVNNHLSMKLKFKQIEKNSFNSIYTRRTDQPYLGQNWHFHQEFELIYFLKGHGMRIVGDHISNFNDGELVLVGEWLPHLWRNDAEPKLETGQADYIIIKFLKEFEGVNLFALPELSEIRQLLLKSAQGLVFSKTVLPKVHDLIIELHESKSTSKIINFLRLLQILATEEQVQALSSLEFVLPTQIARENRLQKVINYIFTNYTQPITLAEIAGIAFMSPPAFCRFFKNSTNKTFFHFLNEFRISKSCQLLINGEKTIKEVCYEVGFNSLTNFNRAFKNFKNSTPSAYRNLYKAFQN